MITFSASKGSTSKIYYKGYKKKTAQMSKMGAVLRDFSLSSFIYGNGETSKGEQCEGHRAQASITGAGNILLFDFDSGDVTFDYMVTKLKDVSAYIAPSRGWSEQHEKLHVVIELDDFLTAGNFKRIYKAVAQQLGLEGLYDRCMEAPSQQMSPHFRTDAPEAYSKGMPVCVDTALSNYVEPEVLPGAGSKEGLAGYVDSDARFTLSNTGEHMSVNEMLAEVLSNGKTRVHCIKELNHDERPDSAFVTKNDAGNVYYHCTGGRCGETLGLLDNPFGEEEEELGEVVPAPVTLYEWADRALELVHDNPLYRDTLGEKATDSQRVEAVSYAGLLCLDKLHVKQINSIISIYNGTHWEALFSDSASLYSFIAKLCHSMAGPFYTMATNHYRTDSIAKMIKKSVPEAGPAEPGNYLNLQNCVLRIGRSGEHVLPHDAKYQFTYVLPYSYDKKAVCGTWSTMINMLMLDNPQLVDAFQDAFGYLLLRDFNVEKMVALVGDGSNGKTTVMRVLKNLVGRQGYGAYPLKQLVKDSSDGDYARAQMAGKLINITNELTPTTLEADAFKDLISGEDITARHPYGQPFIMESVPKQLVAMNTTKHLIKENTFGFIRRLHLIPFSYRLTEKDHDLDIHSKLDAELPGILNWVLKGAERVLANERMQSAPLMGELMDKVLRDNNPVQQFVEDCLMLGEGLFTKERAHELTKLATVFENYKIYCQENNYKALGKNSFKNEIVKIGVEHVYQTVRLGGKAVQVSGLFCVIVNEAFL